MSGMSRPTGRLFHLASDVSTREEEHGRGGSKEGTVAGRLRCGTILVRFFVLVSICNNCTAAVSSSMHESCQGYTSEINTYMIVLLTLYISQEAVFEKILRYMHT